ncbi:MAG: glycosyltransferase family 39 protein [Verrucomicrobia bacterium]|nr:glycosyltransferase family 39 protein [Verrucomicrobiota bacterium]MCF7709108.1 glycosyltransferase family 39 protein [Verrucomicrobiota bacterium]
MEDLISLDRDIFRLINESMVNPFLDIIMPFLSGNGFFVPALIIITVLALWKGSTRTRLCVFMCLLILPLGYDLILDNLKHLIDRPRPFVDLENVRLLVEDPQGPSMPSAHAGNWFAAMILLFIYYRRSILFMLPIAALVGFSRVYNGVHYPSDVIAGALIGCTYAFLGAMFIEQIWIWLGQKWFPIWWRKSPALVPAGVCASSIPDKQATTPEDDQAEISELNLKKTDSHWRRLGYLLIGCALLFRLAYIGADKIELSEDEAYHWVCSKHPAISYYSNPPMIAYTQLAGTSLWGDTEFGIRFFSPLVAAAISLMILGFLRREVNGRTGFWVVLCASATPLLAAGSILMTIDSLSVLFWLAACISGYYAVKNDSTAHWLLTGLWLGLGFLSKYIALAQLISFALFFALHKPARAQLKKPGPYLALLLLALGTLPVIIWNYRHDWATVTHLGERGVLDESWQFSLRYFWEFIGSEAVVLNPFFFLAITFAAFAFWKKYKHNRLLLYWFCMGAPVFFGYWLFSLGSRVLPNWIAPAVIPLFILATVYFDLEYRNSKPSSRLRTWTKRLLTASLGLGLVAVTLMHDTNLIGKIAGRNLPADTDPLRRVRSWSNTAELVKNQRDKLAKEGIPTFIIGDHYGTTGILSFYIPKAKSRIKDDPLVFCESSDEPDNQFYFRPGYENRTGQNALYVRQTASEEPPPQRIKDEFESVENLGLFEVEYRNRLFHTLQIFACRNLR